MTKGRKAGERQTERRGIKGRSSHASGKGETVFREDHREQNSQPEGPAVKQHILELEGTGSRVERGTSS